MFALRHRRLLHSAGFTLVELLVAVGLTSILLWGMLQLFTSAQRFTTTLSAEAELCAMGRAVLERMTRELSTTVPPPNGIIPVMPDGGDFDSIRFKAPVVDGGITVGDVTYATSGSGSSQALERTVDGAPAPFGVNVSRFNVQYIDDTGTPRDGTPAEMPRAIRIEIRLEDPRGQAALTLASSAYLPGSGM